MKMPGDRAVVALDGTTLSIAWRSGRANGAWRWETAPCDGTSVGIAAVFAALEDKAPIGVSVRVTLLRPLANARTLTFPSMSRDALESVLARDWTRYVIGVRATPHTVAARQIGHGQWRAVFAPTDTLEAIANVAEELKWGGFIIQSSDDALASVVGDSKESIVIACDDNGPTDAVQLREGEPVLGRRFHATATDDALAFVERNGAPSVVIIGAPISAARLAQTIGRSARVVDTQVGAGTPAGVIIATTGASGRPSLELLSPSARGGRSREIRRMSGWVWLATAAALIVAFAIERWGVSSALDDVRRRRADISAQVSNAMAARNGIEADAEAASALSEREAAASRVSGVIAAVANALPTGTSLTMLSVTGDSVTIEGESKRTATVYDALRTVSTLEQVRLAGPIRQERQAGDIAVERFAFNARIKNAPVQKR
jgi:hypothetical protein